MKTTTPKLKLCHTRLNLAQKLKTREYHIHQPFSLIFPDSCAYNFEVGARR